MKIRLKEVAEEVGVSVNTVSRALNGKSEISPETKERILEVAAKLGYRPNKLARGLRCNKTGTIGGIVADIANPYFAMLVNGIVKTTRTYDYSIVLQSTDEDYDREEEAIQVLLTEQVEGVLIAPTQKGIEAIEKLSESGVPFVLVSRYFTELDTDYVIMDDVQGGFLAADYLLKKGHERIAMVNGPLHISSARERFEGYQKALSEHGLDLDTSLVSTEALTMDDGYRAARRLLRGSPPSAIFTFSDFVALGVMRALRERGLKVPKDVAVVGFDDIPFASCLETPLTTVRGATETLGSRAAEVLIQKLRGKEEAERSRIRLPVQLVVRATA